MPKAVLIILFSEAPVFLGKCKVSPPRRFRQSSCLIGRARSRTYSNHPLYRFRLKKLQASAEFYPDSKTLSAFSRCRSWSCRNSIAQTRTPRSRPKVLMALVFPVNPAVSRKLSNASIDWLPPKQNPSQHLRSTPIHLHLSPYRPRLFRLPKIPPVRLSELHTIQTSLSFPLNPFRLKLLGSANKSSKRSSCDFF